MDLVWRFKHLHRLRANLAFDNSLPSALRELHKLQAIQMLQQQQQQQQHHQLRQRRPNKQCQGDPLLPAAAHQFLSDGSNFHPDPGPDHLSRDEPRPHLDDLCRHRQNEEGRQREKDGWAEEQERREDVMEVLVAEDLTPMENGHSIGLGPGETEGQSVCLEATMTPGSDDELEEEDDLLAEEILAESKEVQVNEFKPTRTGQTTVKPPFLFHRKKLIILPTTRTRLCRFFLPS